MADIQVSVELNFSDEFFTKLRNSVTEAIVQARGISGAEDAYPEAGEPGDDRLTHDDIRAVVMSIMEAANSKGRGEERSKTVRTIFNEEGKGATTITEIPKNCLGKVLRELKKMPNG